MNALFAAILTKNHGLAIAIKAIVDAARDGSNSVEIFGASSKTINALQRLGYRLRVPAQYLPIYRLTAMGYDDFYPATYSSIVEWGPSNPQPKAAPVEVSCVSNLTACSPVEEML